MSKDADGEVKKSIENIGDKFYVKQERNVISGNDSNEWRNQVYNHINRSVRRGQDITVYSVDGDALTITEDTAGKARFRNYVTLKDGSKRTMTDEEYAVKLRAESHIDELSAVSKRGKKTVPDYKEHSFAKDGFNYRTAYFLDNDNKYYMITLSVGKNGVINTVYNVGKIKETDAPFVAQRPTHNEVEEQSVSNTNLSQNNNDVNSSILENLNLLTILMILSCRQPIMLMRT